jgi:hypothetical protein
MPISVFKRARGGKEQLDIQEAYNIWNWLRIRYNSLETFQFYANLVHDRDFSLLLDRFLEDTKKHMEAMEAEGKAFKLPVPDQPPVAVKFQASINQVTDKFIYKKIFADMMAELFTISRTVRSTTTNDRLRELFTQDMLAHIRNFELLYKFSKAKGWEEVPPTYKSASPIGKEDLTLTEAFHLWDHLTQRYDQRQTLDLFASVAHDYDFKLALNQLLESVTGRINALEQEMIRYGVPLPERPPSSIEMTIDPESLKDRFMYGRILTGIVEAIDLHMRAIIETIKNDALRSLFLSYLKEEVSLFDRFLKYGKAKGWTKIVPIYGEPVS